MSYSKEYLEELKTLHNKKTFGLNRNIPEIVHKIIKENNIKSFLDFGAGKGHTSATISQTYPEIDLHTFDPATFPNPLPKEVELTYSSDVLEHVEPDLIDETLNDLCARSTRYQYHLIACHPAKKALSDGRNAHLIIENPKWWKNRCFLFCYTSLRILCIGFIVFFYHINSLYNCFIDLRQNTQYSSFFTFLRTRDYSNGISFFDFYFCRH